jgi:hypothetical protein
MGRAIVNKTMKKGGTMKKAQTGVTTKKGRTTMNIDSSGYAAGKKSGFPAQMISPKTKYSKGDTTNVTVNSKMVKKSIKKAQNGTSQGRSSRNINYERTAPLQKGTSRDRNLTNTVRQDARRMAYRNKDANEFIGPLTKLKSQTSTEDRGTDMTSPNYYLTTKARLDRQQKNGGKTKSASKKMVMKTGGKMTKKCKYGCN